MSVVYSVELQGVAMADRLQKISVLPWGHVSVALLGLWLHGSIGIVLHVRCEDIRLQDAEERTGQCGRIDSDQSLKAINFAYLQISIA
jgi:hypothetical protein